MIETYLKPFFHNHSIKEAVIGVFLVNPIIKPERFQKLINGGFNQDFHLFEPVNTLQIQINPGNKISQSTQNLPTAGFKFIGFKEGRIGRVFQGVNEVNRTFLSYHSFSYNRWSDFLEDYLKFIKILSSEQNDLFIRAISIHYVDEFKWIAPSEIDLSKVFNDKATYMSKAFLESSNTSNFIYTTEKSHNQNVYFDRLEIKVDNKLTKNISISHNITKQLDDVINLSPILESRGTELIDTLLELHKYNKEILDDILNKDVKQLINLPQAI